MATNYPTGDTDQAIVVWGGDGVKAVDIPVGVTGTGVMAATTPSEGIEALASGEPVAQATSRLLSAEDNGKTLVLTGTPLLTIDMGLPVGFGCAIKGDFTYAVTSPAAATVTDVRDAGAVSPWCAVVQTGTDTYDLVGSKV